MIYIYTYRANLILIVGPWANIFLGPPKFMYQLFMGSCPFCPMFWLFLLIVMENATVENVVQTGVVVTMGTGSECRGGH